MSINNKDKGSGCGSVGRAVAFDTRGPRFDSSHRQNFIEHLFIINRIEKTKINKKRPGMAHFKKTIVLCSIHIFGRCFLKLEVPYKGIVLSPIGIIFCVLLQTNLVPPIGLFWTFYAIQANFVSLPFQPKRPLQVALTIWSKQIM